MFSFFDIPNDVMGSGILNLLSREELYKLRLVSKGAKAACDANTSLQIRIREEFGDHVEAIDCKQKYLIRYLFEKGISYLRGTQKKPNEKLKQRGLDCFSQAKTLIDTLPAIPTIEQPAINYMLGYIYVCGYGAERDIKKGIEYLQHSANAKPGNPSAMMLLAAIYSSNIAHHPACFITEGLTFEANIYDEQLGLAWLMKAYAEKNDTAGVIYATDIAFIDKSLTKENIEKFKLPATFSTKAQAELCARLADLARTLPAGEGGNTLATSLLYQASSLGNVNATLELLQDSLRAESLHSFQSSRRNLAVTFRPIEIELTVPSSFYLQIAANQGSSLAHLRLGKDQCLMNPKKALEYFEHGTKSIKDFDYHAAGNCALELAKHYYEKGDLKKAFKWYKRGAELGNYDCSIEAGYLCVHYHKELGIFNGLQEADRYLNDALIIIQSSKLHSPYSVFGLTSTISNNEHATNIAKYFISHKDAEKHKEANLQQYVKLNLRAITYYGERSAVDELTNLFSAPKPTPATLSSLFVNSDSFSLNINSRDDKLARDIRTIYIRTIYGGSTPPSLNELKELASRCYQALGIPVIEDECLIKLMSSPQALLRRPSQ